MFRRIKSCPANLSEMVNKKKVVSKHTINDCEIFIFSLDNKNCKMKNNYINLKKKIITFKTIKNTINGIISDSYLETNKYISLFDNYIFNYFIEFINNFISNKFNKQNFQNFIITLMIRYVFNNIYHEVLVKIKENINLINN